MIKSDKDSVVGRWQSLTQNRDKEPDKDKEIFRIKALRYAS
jgi:hypothetical protein